MNTQEFEKFHRGIITQINDANLHDAYLDVIEERGLTDKQRIKLFFEIARNADGAATMILSGTWVGHEASSETLTVAASRRYERLAQEIRQEITRLTTQAARS